MRIGLQIPRFTWPDQPASIAPTLARIAETADDAGFASLWAMDHFFQIQNVGAAEEPMLEGYSVLNFLAAHSKRPTLGLMVTGVIYRHPGILVKTVTTLDVLIARHGVPAFIKLDVEGFEAEALHGLMHKVSALSFEFTTIQRDVALACIERCAAMGYTRFNAALGESQALVGEWMTASDVAGWLMALPQSANSGDIYAVAT